MPTLLCVHFWLQTSEVKKDKQIVQVTGRLSESIGSLLWSEWSVTLHFTIFYCRILPPCNSFMFTK